MWAKAERRWRKRGKRGVSPIIATILLVAITVVLAAVLYILISGLTKGPGNTPLGSALAVGPASESVNGSANQYVFAIVSASGGLTLNNLQFQVQNPSGGVVTLTGGSIIVTGLTGAGVGTYTLATGAWSAGGTLTVSNQMHIVLQCTNNLAAAGNSLVVLGTGSFSGSVTAAIP
ncbi:MAG TPA: archaellin/type IV pilin N-terminal domain-containing protein [Thermoplasmata archaeon]|nr:archaellin/type IV pilin N-terminal domain-containing protein [Thermoplasmata archaeon]